MGCHALLQGHLPDPRIELVSLVSPTLADGFFTTSTIWEPPSQQQMKLNNSWPVISMLFFDPPEKSQAKTSSFHLSFIKYIIKHV